MMMALPWPLEKSRALASIYNIITSGGNHRRIERNSFVIAVFQVSAFFYRAMGTEPDHLMPEGTRYYWFSYGGVEMKKSRVS